MELRELGAPIVSEVDMNIPELSLTPAQQNNAQSGHQVMVDSQIKISPWMIISTCPH